MPDKVNYKTIPELLDFIDQKMKLQNAGMIIENRNFVEMFGMSFIQERSYVCELIPRMKPNYENEPEFTNFVKWQKRNPT